LTNSSCKLYAGGTNYRFLNKSPR